ncbi:ROK family transcriptional regulator [Microbacterium terrisoli]|uniref:ROK family transcriptional regulator n=1 Tax=Microbacterium terrisoli TaxID=3242192 RepID=UPI0028055393|nr:ROK family transcriptional regulator [Microbacterium protaetiae]
MDGTPYPSAGTSSRGLIFSEIARSPGSSRQRLAARLGLVPATVGTHVRTLVKHGFVQEGAPLTTTSGRPSIPLEPREDGGVLVGVSIERTGILAAAVTIAGEIADTQHVPIEPGGEIAGIVRAVDALRHALHPRPVIAVGVTVSGVVDTTDGTVLISTVLGWHDYPLGAELRKIIPLPVFVENDVIALAQRELAFAPTVPDSFLLLHIGDGVGMAIVTARSIVRGVRHGSIEFGHISTDPNGALCRCGNRGCVQTVFGYAELNAGAPAGALGASDMSQDAATAAFLEDRSRELGRAVGSVSTLLGIDHIRVSGRTTQYWAAIAEPLTASIASSTPTLGASPTVDVVAWTSAGVARGAAGVALGSYLESLR